MHLQHAGDEVAGLGRVGSGIIMVLDPSRESDCSQLQQVNSIGNDRVEGVGCGRGQRSGKRALTWRIGVLVNKDRNEARDLTQCWLVITGKNGGIEQEQNQGQSREEEGGDWRMVED